MLKIIPTKSNLLKMKEEIKTARQGHSLLDRKRQVLILELMRLSYQYKELNRKVEEAFQKAMQSFKRAVVLMGEEEVERASLLMPRTLQIDITLRGVMGVPLPQLSIPVKKFHLNTSLLETSAAWDDLARAFYELLELLAEWITIKISLVRVAREIQKTQKRVNALEKIIIPSYEETIKYIEDALAETEREEFFRRKRLKAKA